MIDKVVASASQIKLSGGLVGRVCTVVLGTCISIGTIGAVSQNAWIQGGAILTIVVIAFPVLWRTISFAEKNPHVAILDGAEFLKHEELHLASKYSPEIVVSPKMRTQAQPASLTSQQLAQINQPDDALLIETTESKKGG